MSNEGRKSPLPQEEMDLELVKRRLYGIVINGNDVTAVQAARVLLRDTDQNVTEGVDNGMLDELWLTLKTSRVTSGESNDSTQV